MSINKFVSDGFEGEQHRYLTQLVLDITAELNKKDSVNKYTYIPDKLGVGRIYYFSNEVLPDIKYPGFWGYEEDGWVYLGDRNTVEAAYGGLKLTTPLAYPDFDEFWQILQFDTISISTPIGVIQDLANNALIIEEAGVYNINVTFAVTHDEATAGRELNFRLRDTITGQVSVTSKQGTGRNSAVSNFTVSAIVDSLNPTNPIVIEVAANTSAAKDIYKDVIATSASFSLNKISSRV